MNESQPRFNEEPEKQGHKMWPVEQWLNNEENSIFKVITLKVISQAISQFGITINDRDTRIENVRWAVESFVEKCPRAKERREVIQSKQIEGINIDEVIKVIEAFIAQLRMDDEKVQQRLYRIILFLQPKQISKQFSIQPEQISKQQIINIIHKVYFPNNKIYNNIEEDLKPVQRGWIPTEDIINIVHYVLNTCYPTVETVAEDTLVPQVQKKLARELKKYRNTPIKDSAVGTNGKTIKYSWKPKNVPNEENMYHFFWTYEWLNKPNTYQNADLYSLVVSQEQRSIFDQNIKGWNDKIPKSIAPNWHIVVYSSRCKENGKNYTAVYDQSWELKVLCYVSIWKDGKTNLPQNITKVIGIWEDIEIMSIQYLQAASQEEAKDFLLFYDKQKTSMIKKYCEKNSEVYSNVTLGWTYQMIRNHLTENKIKNLDKLYQELKRQIISKIWLVIQKNKVSVVANGSSMWGSMFANENQGIARHGTGAWISWNPESNGCFRTWLFYLNGMHEVMEKAEKGTIVEMYFDNLYEQKK